MDQNRMTVTVSISTDPRTAHIGRYFIDVRDTTRQSDPLRARQIKTFIKDRPGTLRLIDGLRDEARRQNVHLSVVNDTLGELPID
jgi:hypothetical protein